MRSRFPKQQLSSIFLTFLDQFSPLIKTPSHPSEQLQNRTIVAFSLGFAASTMMVLLFIPQPSPGIITLVLATTSGYLIALVILKMTNARTIAALITCCSCFLCFLFIGFHKDGLIALIHPYNLVIPLLAVYVGGIRMGIGFAVAVSVEIVIAIWFHKSGWLIDTDFLPADPEYALTWVGVLAVPVIVLLSSLNYLATRSAEVKLSETVGILLKKEEEIRTKETRYSELFENMSDGVVVYEAVDNGSDFVFKEINQSALNIDKISKKDAIGQRVTKVFPGVKEMGMLQILQKVFHEGLPGFLPACFYQDQRISGWRENHVYRLPTREVVAVYRDVTAHKTTEQALRSALESMERLIDSVPFALVVVHRQSGKIHHANAIAGDLLGLAPSALVDQSWFKFHAESPANTAMMRYADECIITNRQGNAITVLLSSIPLVINGEEMLVKSFLDLTEFKKLEIQLHQAQKLEAVGQLAAGISHEINTPIQFVGDNLKFLQTTFSDLLQLNAKYHETLATLPVEEQFLADIHDIDKSADLEYIVQNIPAALNEALEGIARVTSIIQAMKEFSHLGGKNKISVDVNKALRTTLVVSRNTYKYVADVITEFGDLPLVWGLSNELNQVFLNLIVNATHAIEDAVGNTGGRGRIQIRTSRVRDMVRVEITDNGCGIPNEIRERVYEPFFTTKAVGRGTGQGLAIAHHIIVDQHNGSLTFESEVGKGTTFNILLPISENPLNPQTG